MNCTNCGALLPDGAVFCGKCGAAVPQTPSPADLAVQPAIAAIPQQNGAYQQYQQQADAYQQPGYQQPQPVQPAQQTWSSQSATHRALAMILYVSGLIGLIFALCVRDKDDAFITHHLNNVVVILIGSIIGGILSVVVVGLILLIYLFVMSIMGIVSAYNGDMKELPLMGKIHIVK